MTSNDNYDENLPLHILERQLLEALPQYSDDETRRALTYFFESVCTLAMGNRGGMDDHELVSCCLGLGAGNFSDDDFTEIAGALRRLDCTAAFSKRHSRDVHGRILLAFNVARVVRDGMHLVLFSR